MEGIGDTEITLRLVKSGWNWWCSGPSLKIHECELCKVNVVKEESWESFGQSESANKNLAAMKRAKYSASIVNGEEGYVSDEWFTEIFSKSWLMCGRGGKGMNAGFVQFTEVTAPSNMIEENIVCNCMRGWASDKIYHSVPKVEPEGGTVGAWGLYGI